MDLDCIAHGPEAFNANKHIIIVCVHQWPVTPIHICVRNIEIHEHNTRHRLDPHVISRDSTAMSKTFIHKVLSYG